jgi:osmotically-inducible protein OsmY
VRLFDEPAATLEATELNRVNGVDSSHTAAHQKFLETAIEDRIRSRLQGRVRNLKVEVHDTVVTLHGQCATYYSKQLAQHAAMGVLEDEHLENAIVVCVGQ